jgi:hypothetical protein
MSKDTTASSKQTQRTTDGGGGSTAAAFGGHATGSAAAAFGGCAANQVGSTKQVGSTTSPLATALVLKYKFTELLHIMLRLFLQPLATSELKKFATAYYANKKHKETKSDQNYVSKSIKALGFLLQGLPEVEQSKGLKALRNNFTIDFEKFRMSIMQKYVFPVKDLNVEAKKHQFYIAFCKLLCGLMTIYIAQCGIRGYPKDVAIADLVAAKNDTILVPINMNTKQFLKAYVKAHGIQVFTKLTIDIDIADLINKVNGAPPINAAANVDANQEENGEVAPPQDQAEGVDDRNQDNEMMKRTTNAKLIGSRVAVCHNIVDAIMKCVIKTIQLFCKQRLDNKEAKQMKAAIMLP